MKLKFNSDGLIPLIIQDSDSGTVLSLFYANQEAMDKMQKTGYVWRFSRSKNRLMKKGEESGNVQKVISISEDCDSDALLVKVKPWGPACHKGTVSCFGSGVQGDFSPNIISELVTVLKDRKKNPKKGSYTSSIIINKQKIIAKLREECEEFIEAGEKKEDKEVIWEAADLLFFMLVYLGNRDIEFADVLNELKRRRK